MRPMIGRNPFTQGWLLIEDRVLNAVLPFQQRDPSSTEAGGILMGFRRDHHLHVDELTCHFPGDTRARTSFCRGRVGHAQIATNRWTSSGHTSDYLGEWHTHPENHPTPSGTDLREWRALLRGHDRPLVFLIVGIRGWWIGVGRGNLIERVEWSEAN